MTRFYSLRRVSSLVVIVPLVLFVLHCFFFLSKFDRPPGGEIKPPAKEIKPPSSKKQPPTNEQRVVNKYQTPHFRKINLNTKTERLKICPWLEGQLGRKALWSKWKKHRQNSHLIIDFPTSERCERTSERTSEWPSTAVCIFGCSRP